MSTNVSAEALQRLLDRMPTVAWSSRFTPATGAMEWIYVSPRMAELHGLPSAAQEHDPAVLMERIVPEDRARLDEQLAASFQTLAPMAWTGRLVHADGSVRWIETLSTFEREADGRIVAYGNGSDVTERKGAEDALAVAETGRESSEALYRAAINSLPLGVCIMDLDAKFAVINEAQQRMSGPPSRDVDNSVLEKYGLFMADGVTPLVMTEVPMLRALRGAFSTEESEIVVRNGYVDSEVRMKTTTVQLRDAAGTILGALAVSQDITTQRALEQELVSRNDQLAASEEAKTVLIDRLRYSIDELSNPILEVWDDVLVMPIIGVVDSRRTADMVQRLLAEVARTQASFVIVDLTGVEIVDTKTADHLMRLMRKVEIVGARCVLTGIRPAVAETLVDIGVDFGRITTLRNLKHGLREAVRFARRERDGARDLIADDESADDLTARRRAR
jgi:rsbT co-antagonist protein RsbR